MDFRIFRIIACCRRAKFKTTIINGNINARAAPYHRLSCTCSSHKRYFSNDPVLSRQSTYDQVFARSIEQPEEFWGEIANDIVWHKKWDKVLDNSNPPFTKWFVGGELNTCYNMVDRHVDEGNGDHVAIIFDSPVTNTIRSTTYKELQHEVSRLAGVLRKHGVGKGDRVLIYMPMVPQAIVTMMATTRIGAMHSLVFGGFASKELSVRIEHAEPKVIVSANCGLEPGRTVPYKPMLDDALSMINFKPNRCIILNRPGFEQATMKKDMDVDYDTEMVSASPVDCVPIPATDPAYVLYTSGTTGQPKAVVRPSGGHAVVLKWSMWNIYGLRPKEVWWAASDLGWIVGHSYIVYAPLFNCNTTVIYEGKPVGTPDPGSFFRVLKEHNVASMFVAPTALRAIIREDPSASFSKKYMPLKRFRGLFVAGEHCDVETMEWSRKIFDSPVLDNWWQTETGWAITSTCVGLDMPLHPAVGVTGKPVPGWNVKVLRPDKTETDSHELGQIYVKTPLPPGAFTSLWKNEKRYQETYFTDTPGFYNTMDAGYRDEDGYISVMSRTDDVINVAGHRLSTGALEEAMLMNDDVVDAAVIGVPDKLKGQTPLGLCVLKDGIEKSEKDIIDGIIDIVRKQIGPVASFKQVVMVPKLPKTRSGKIARNTLAAIAAGKPYKIPGTIEDANVYPAIEKALTEHGFPKRVEI